MFEHDLDYLSKQLEFARTARTQVGLADALSRADDAVRRLREQSFEYDRRIALMDRNLDSLLAFANGQDEPSDAELDALFAR